jgi:hypothetical protein
MPSLTSSGTLPSAYSRYVNERSYANSVNVSQVSIPWQAHYQARAYTERYGTSVNLITSFPAFNLDDPEQLLPSLGPTAWRAGEVQPQSPKVIDWYPEGIAGRSDDISVLVRTARGSSSSKSFRSSQHLDQADHPDVVPLTLLAHFAAISTNSRSPLTSASLAAKAAATRRPPVPVDVFPDTTLDELKAALLLADGRKVAKLDQITLWQVEMTEDEMVVIEERGGLKKGQMPWP